MRKLHLMNDLLSQAFTFFAFLGAYAALVKLAMWAIVWGQGIINRVIR